MVRPIIHSPYSHFSSCLTKWKGTLPPFVLRSVFHKIGLKDFDGSILHLHRIPETWEVAEFLRHLYTVTKFSPECFIIAMIYISRILNNPHCVILTSCTWRQVHKKKIHLCMKIKK